MCKKNLATLKPSNTNAWSSDPSSWSGRHPGLAQPTLISPAVNTWKTGRDRLKSKTLQPVEVLVTFDIKQTYATVIFKKNMIADYSGSRNTFQQQLVKYFYYFVTPVFYHSTPKGVN